MPWPHAPVPAALTSGPFTRQTAFAHHVTAKALRGPSYRAVMRGAHACTSTDATYAERIRATRVVLPGAAVLGGRSALWVWGVDAVAADDPVEIVLPPRRRVRARAEVLVRGDLLRPGEAVDSPWGLVTTPARTAFDVARRGVLRQTVPLLDELVRTTGVTADEVTRIAREHRGARYLTRVAPAVTEMDGRSESVRESLLRLLVVEAGFPRPAVQYTIRDGRGCFVARVDLAWPDIRLALEYDGSHHDSPEQIAHDRRRLNALHACGWRVVVIDRHQFRDEAQVVGTIRAMRTSAGGPRL